MAITKKRFDLGNGRFIEFTDANLEALRDKSEKEEADTHIMSFPGTAKSISIDPALQAELDLKNGIITENEFYFDFRYCCDIMKDHVEDKFSVKRDKATGKYSTDIADNEYENEFELWFCPWCGTHLRDQD